MGTYVSVFSEDLQQSEQIFSALRSCDDTLSSYKKQALIYQLNAQKHLKSTPMLRRAFSDANVFFNETDGAFNVAMGAITRQLMHYDNEATMPPLALRERADVDVHKIDWRGDVIRIAPSIRVDFGGMGKGFCLDEALKVISKTSNVMVAASGDIACVGPCSVRVENPNQNRPFATIYAENLRVSSSGIYRHYIQQMQNNHLIDPKSKKSASRYLQVTLFSDQNSSALDAYATAANFMPFTTFHRLIVRHKIGYLLIANDKSKYLFIPSSLAYKVTVSGFKFASE